MSCFPSTYEVCQGTRGATRCYCGVGQRITQYTSTRPSPVLLGCWIVPDMTPGFSATCLLYLRTMHEMVCPDHSSPDAPCVPVARSVEHPRLSRPVASRGGHQCRTMTKSVVIKTFVSRGGAWPLMRWKQLLSWWRQRALLVRLEDVNPLRLRPVGVDVDGAP